MRIIGYYPESITNGVGIRQVFFLSGCPHHCEGCHNPESWEYLNGDVYSIDDVASKALNSPYNVTFSGGEPLTQPFTLSGVCAKIQPHRTIWVYSGYTWEEIMANELLRMPLQYIDVLVDGRFQIDKRDTTLKFRGSSNQRIIDVQRSLEANKIILWEDAYGKEDN